MKRRTLAYFKKNRALKVFCNAAVADLSTLLTASMELSRSNIVRRHISATLQTLKAA